jgi:hypothetical protein
VGEDCAANRIGTDAELDRDREAVVADLQPTQAVRWLRDYHTAPG